MLNLKKKVIDFLATTFGIYMILFPHGFYITVLMIIRNLFDLSIPSSLILTQMQHLGMFLAGLLLLTFLTKPIKKDGPGLFDWTLGILGASSGIYMFIIYPQLMKRMGIVAPLDIIFGILAIVLIVEAGRRTIGLPIAILTIVFIIYGLFDAKFKIGEFVARVYLYNVGIFSNPFQVALSMIFVFLFFGELLSEIGVGKFFTDLAFAFSGSKRGGPAKVAVVASSLMGTMSGSATGNAVTTGTFTIPLMKKTGYKAETAAAIEASASTGGQIMPPVLGSAAFIMPLFLGITYWKVVVASILPAIVYYISLYFFVDQEARKLKLFGLPKSELPKVKTLLPKLYYLLPLVILVVVLVAGFEAEQAAIASITMALLIEWFTRKGVGFKGGTIFIIALLILAFIFNRIGINIYSILVLLGTLAIFVTIFVGLIIKGTKEMAHILLNSLKKSFKDVISIAIACAMAGVISGVLAYTGLAITISRLLITISGGNLLVLLLLSAIVVIILGMGMPTPAVYVLGATMIAPALVQLGVNPVAAHYFIFYFGILAPLTPPVAVTSYAAAAIANSDPWKTGFEAFRLALAGWFVALSFVKIPEFLLVSINNFSFQVFLKIAIAFILSILTAFSTVALFSNYFFGEISRFQKLFLFLTIVFSILSLFVNLNFTILSILIFILSYPNLFKFFKVKRKSI
ncbi:MAG: TRAP transporter permease [Caldisericia bacterium]